MRPEKLLPPSRAGVPQLAELMSQEAEFPISLSHSKPQSYRRLIVTLRGNRDLDIQMKHVRDLYELVVRQFQRPGGIHASYACRIEERDAVVFEPNVEGRVTCVSRKGQKSGKTPKRQGSNNIFLTCMYKASVCGESLEKCTFLVVNKTF